MSRLKGFKHSEETRKKISEANKGQIPWTKGKHHSEATRRKIGLANSISLKGKKLSEEHKKKISISHKGLNTWMKGKRHSKETKIKMSESAKRIGTGKWSKGKKLSEEIKRKISDKLKGKRPYIMTLEIRKRMSESQVGKKLSDKTKIKISEANVGDKCYFFGKHYTKEKSYSWKGGITPENHKIRRSMEMILWREAVFARDNFTCQKTKIRSGEYLHAHHIQNFSKYPELRFVIDNGITLSKKSHDEFHKIYGYKNNTKEQLNEFLCRE